MILVSALAVISLAGFFAVKRADLSGSLLQQAGKKQTEEYEDRTLSLTVADAADLLELEKYSKLETLNLSGSTCYPEIEEYIREHPQVDVSYTLPIPSDGEEVLVGNKDNSVTLSDESAVAKLTEYSAFLHEISEIHMSRPCDADAFSVLEEAYPQAQIFFSVSESICECVSSISELDLSGASPDEIENITGFLPCMRNLKHVRLTKEDGGNSFSLLQASEIVNALPSAEFDYRFEMFGKCLTINDKSIEFIGNETGLIGNEGLGEIEQMIPCLKQLESLYFEYCDIDYDLLSALRDKYPNLNIVWRINFGPYSCRTDREMIFANGSLTTSDCYNLRYCNKVKYIDLGHNDGITAIDFVAYMPELEVGIFAVGGLYDISAISQCKNLKYLEIFTSRVYDLSPIAACTNLEHLNISCLPASDISSLYSLNKLKRFWCTCSNVPQSQRNEIQELMPECSFCFAYVEPTGNHWRFNDDGSRVDEYERIAQIFGYDNWRDNITYW